MLRHYIREFQQQRGEMADETNTSVLLPIDIEAEMRKSYLDYAMSVIIARAARCARRIEAGAAPHPGGHERPRPGLQPRLPQMRQDLRRHFRQLSSAR